MPKYFLHIVSGEERTEDPDGSELINIDEAKLEAVHCARDLMACALRDGARMGLHKSFSIESDGGELLASVAFLEAFHSDDLAIFAVAAAARLEPIKLSPPG
jgi:hypothetical protein